MFLGMKCTSMKMIRWERWTHAPPVNLVEKKRVLGRVIIAPLKTKLDKAREVCLPRLMLQ